MTEAKTLFELAGARTAWHSSGARPCGGCGDFHGRPGRGTDNVFIERLWRSLKYQAVYLHELADGFAAERLHSALPGRTPNEAYRDHRPVDMPVDIIDKPPRALPTSPQAPQPQQGDQTNRIPAA